MGEVISLYVCRFSIIIVREKSPYLKLLRAVGIILSIIDSCIPNIIPHSLGTCMYACTYTVVLIERTWMTHTYSKELALRR